MSSEYDTIYVQEATELTEGDWEDLTTRLRWGRMPYQQMIGDCNPGPPSHWLKRRANDKRTVMLESRHEDNPTLWTGSGWTTKGQQYLAKLDALSGARFKRLRQGIWAAAEGMVYEDYDPAIHLIPRFDIPRSWPRIWCVDFGYTNPFVWQAWAESPDGKLYRYLEIYKTQTLVEDHAITIRQVCKLNNEPVPRAVICDHDAEDRATLERHLGHIVGTTIPAFKSISPGIQAVQSRMRKGPGNLPRLFFLRDSLVERDAALDDLRRPCCTEEEIEGYVWPNNPKKVVDVPVKKDDHGMDAMRYLVAAVDAVQLDPSEMERQIPGVQWETISQY
jgi:phage terminase large subunit